MDPNRKLPANPGVPLPAVTESLHQSELRKLCSKFGIGLSFKSTRTGKQEIVSNRVLRQRLEELRTGHLRARFMKGGGGSEEEGDEEAEKDIPHPTPTQETPVPEPIPVPVPASEAVPAPVPVPVPAPTPARSEEDELAAMLAAKLKQANGVNEKKVEEIAAKVVTKAIGATASTFAGQVSAVEDKVKQAFILQATEIKKIVAEALEALPARRIEVVTPTTKVTMEDTHQQFPQVMDMVLSGDPVFMVGNAGTGKTTIARNVANALKLPFYYLTCTIETSRGDLIGRQDMKTGEWEDGPLTICGEQGGVFLLDEISAADGNTLMNFNTLIEVDEWYIPRRKHCPRFRRHKDFYVLAADNTFGTGATRMFSSRNQMDAATLDRFRSGMIEIDYDHKLEERLCDPGVLAWGRKVREAINKYDIRKIMSTRSLIAFSKKCRMQRPDGKPVFTLAQLQAIYYSDWSKDDRKKVAV